ncbi:hypothetical protein vB_AbaP_Acibel007_10 [Acinetobacter phage vB_AbaP_Acibel007]|uniref:Uncharacterized protein n=1 Tax=Acinetobacter phage vB_AbaP_Acibel007 TaxID=1481187 RepID=A0A075DXY2_9CAUD|nr:hypothetical protein vB_AbaP_Acibel007_10 [Acinetobacter phage vB_AbaP_Acibel007]AHY26781.1 hypothetical protein vB_AbaP_Acibel007_10 [Acinetobacter phage vB_AbaP_Acibel007]
MSNSIRIGRLTLNMGNVTVGVTRHQLSLFMQYSAYQSKF